MRAILKVNRRFALLPSLFALLLLSACATAFALELTPVASGLEQPVAIATAGDGSNRLFVLEQQGQIKIIEDGKLLDQPFLDIRTLVRSGGERGLLGIAFHPNYAENGFFYVNYTREQQGLETVIARFKISSPGRAEPDSLKILMTFSQPFGNHNGGQLAFGPDGYLYIATGDGGSGGDPQDNSQNLNNLLGKILRIDVDNGEPYAIPADNPFVGQNETRPEIWTYGLRNPWRFSFDRATGDLFISDVGQNSLEEINWQEASGSGGENYGWRRMEGGNCFNPSENCNDGSLVLPIIEYPTNLGCAVTGGYRYRGAINELAGQYIYGDYCGGQLWGAIQNADGSWSSQLLMDTSLRISTFGEDEAGEIYVADYASGTIYRLSEETP